MGGFDTSYNGGDSDAFVAKINAGATLAWSSYLGGSYDDYAYGIAIDPAGNAWVTGTTRSIDFAVGGFDTSYNGGDYDAFVAKINADGTFAWSSYLGGWSYDWGSGIAMDAAGNAWVTGDTFSEDWTVGGFDTSYNRGRDAYIAKIFAPQAGLAVHVNTLPHELRFTFDHDASAGLGTEDLLVENLTTGQPIPSSDFLLTYDASIDTATFAYSGSGGGIAGMLADGNYRATLLAAGTTLMVDHVFELHFLLGDANRDGKVNLADFNILAANFGQDDRDFTQGDFNYDGQVTIADFDILAARFGMALPAAGRSLLGTPQAPFGTRAIEQIDALSEPEEVLV